MGRAGLLASLSPLMIPALIGLVAASPSALAARIEPVVTPVAALIAAVTLVGALLLAREPRWGRALMVSAGLSFAGLGTLALQLSPARAMVLLIAVALLGAWIYSAPEAGERGHTRPRSRLARARMAAWGSAVAVLLAIAFGLTAERWTVASLIASLTLTAGLAGRALKRSLSAAQLQATSLRLRLAGLAGLALVSAGLAGALRGHPELAALVLLPAPISIIIELGRHIAPDPLNRVGVSDLMLEQPARLLVGSFLATGLVGAVLLTLPACSTGPRVGLLDAAFTAFSAVCVTGLAVLDTGVDYSGAGQAVIALLIQLGGLGIMSFSTAAMVLLGQRLSLRQEGAVAELIGGDRSASMTDALRRMLVVTGICEATGAIALTILFRALGDGWGAAAWRGLFTSISAYCNAGFALQSDSLVGYQSNPLVLHVIGALIIFGGLGPAVVVSLPTLARRRQLSLHAKIVFLTTAVLLVVPTILIAALEWNHAFTDLTVFDRLHNAWFQSLTTRTAGFNSIDFAALTPASQTLVEALMFIGGSPGSTAGGIKTTTAFVLLATVVQVSRGRYEVVWGGWTIPPATVYRAAAAVTLTAVTVVFAMFALQLTQGMALDVALFEVVSAIGTVGLSIGGTAALDSIGKMLIIGCMFLGRVAPLTMFLIFSRPGSGAGSWGHPKQDVSVG